MLIEHTAPTVYLQHCFAHRLQILLKMATFKSYIYSTRSNPNPPECFKVLSRLCNVCGQFQTKDNLRAPTEDFKDNYKRLFDREVNADGVCSPDKVCGTCRLNVCKNPQFAFRSPMIWDQHNSINELNHNTNNCYCCKLPAIKGLQSKKLKEVMYPYHVSTISPPVPLPKFQTVKVKEENMSEDEGSSPMIALSTKLPLESSQQVSELTSEFSKVMSSESMKSAIDNSPDFKVSTKTPQSSLDPIKMNHKDFGDMCINMDLSISKIKTCFQTLNKLHQLDSSVKLDVFINGHKKYAQFFQTATFVDKFNNVKEYTYCTNSDGLLAAMNLPRGTKSWRVWMDNARITQQNCKQNSFKVALLHVGNKHPPVTLLYSNDIGETYEETAEVLRVINYNKYQWPICVDLKLAALMVGRSGGRPTYPCHLCKWNSLRPKLSDFYNKSEKNVSKIMRTSYSKYTGTKGTSKENFNIDNDALVSPDKILMPPLHIRLGMWQVLFQRLSDKPLKYIQKKFPKKKRSDIFNGPEILKLCRDPEFFRSLTGENEIRAFNAFNDVSTYVLSSKVHSNLTNQELVDKLFDAYKQLGCTLTYKMHLLRSHLELFPPNIDDWSDQHGERFHQQLKTLEKRFVAQPHSSLLQRWCFENADFTYHVATTEEIEIEELEENDNVEPTFSSQDVNEKVFV